MINDDDIIQYGTIAGMISYPPTQPTKQSDSPYIIPIARIEIAKNSGGEFIHKDGNSIFMWRYDALHVAYWDNGSYGAWELWTKEEIPMSELKSL